MCNKISGWNAQNTNGIWWHDFNHEGDNAELYNWALVDNMTYEELPPIWLPVSFASGFIKDGLSIRGMVDVSAGIIDCLLLYDTTAVCCDGHEWMPTLVVVRGSVYGCCQNENCAIDTDGMYHGVKNFSFNNVADWADFAEGLVMQ